MKIKLLKTLYLCHLLCDKRCPAIFQSYYDYQTYWGMNNDCETPPKLGRCLETLDKDNRALTYISGVSLLVRSQQALPLGHPVTLTTPLTLTFDLY